MAIGWSCLIALMQVKNQLILRHDIDFDIKAAYEIALIEHEINVKSTFFFFC